MSGDDTHARTSPFEAIRHEDANGVEYWSARELADVLGYATNYRNFQPVIKRAEAACDASGHAAMRLLIIVRKRAQ